jgi:2-iminobutanoate/2-iminopropanoate deaminase
MNKTIITTAQAPKAIGPYSQAVRAGDWLFLSGQIPLHPETGELVTESFEAQVRQIFTNIGAVLTAAGADFTNVVKATVFLKDMSHFAAMNSIYAEYFPHNPPARSAIQAARLPRDVEIEIEMIAYFGQ